MTLPRKQLISIEDTPYYHIVSRCVRRAFLCGKDKYSGKSYEHRRGLIIERVKFLASVFHINICSYAIMSNHYHLVLKVNDTKDWSIHQVLVNWS
jgi:putative transposase